MPANASGPTGPIKHCSIPPEMYREYRMHVRRNIAAGVTFALLPRHGIFLSAPHGGGERFARLFLETWRRLPLFVRRSVLRHWRTDVSPASPVGPAIELLAEWSTRVRGRGLGGAWGGARDHGHTLRFWAKIVAAFSDELVRDLIAHEVAHVYQWSVGWELDEMNCVEVEEDANWMLDGWGFSATAMDAWATENTHIKAVDIDTLSKSSIRRHEKRAQRAGRWGG